MHQTLCSIRKQFVAGARAGGSISCAEATTLDDLYRRIAAGIHAQYTLGYYSSQGSAAGGWRSVSVLTPAAPAARLRHRPGYYVFTPPVARH